MSCEGFFKFLQELAARTRKRPLGIMDFLPTIESDEEAPVQTPQFQKQNKKDSKKRKREELQAEKPTKRGGTSDDFAGGFTFDNLGGGFASSSKAPGGDVWVRDGLEKMMRAKLKKIGFTRM